MQNRANPYPWGPPYFADLLRESGFDALELIGHFRNAAAMFLMSSDDEGLI
jgi:hypothetical protein